jgi:hypothetical protein
MTKHALTTGKPELTDKQRDALGGKTFVPRVRTLGEALPRDTNKMNTVYKPPTWATRTGR